MGELLLIYIYLKAFHLYQSNEYEVSAFTTFQTLQHCVVQKRGSGGVRWLSAVYKAKVSHSGAQKRDVIHGGLAGHNQAKHRKY